MITFKIEEQSKEEKNSKVGECRQPTSTTGSGASEHFKRHLRENLETKNRRNKFCVTIFKALNSLNFVMVFGFGHVNHHEFRSNNELGFSLRSFATTKSSIWFPRLLLFCSSLFLGFFLYFNPIKMSAVVYWINIWMRHFWSSCFCR